jgi:hypothetical protein
MLPVAMSKLKSLAFVMVLVGTLVLGVLLILTSRGL